MLSPEIFCNFIILSTDLAVFNKLKGHDTCSPSNNLLIISKSTSLIAVLRWILHRNKLVPGRFGMSSDIVTRITSDFE